MPKRLRESQKIVSVVSTRSASGVMLAALGAALTHGHIVGIGIALVLCAFFAYKSRFEERWLSQVYPDYAEYQAIRQEILLQFLRVVEEAGTSLAFPTRTVHLVTPEPATR